MGARRQRGALGLAILAVALTTLGLIEVGERGSADGEGERGDIAPLEQEARQGTSERIRELGERCREAVGSDGTASVTSEVGDLPQVASRLVTGYESEGDTLLYGAYLDLLGDVWGCCVRGDGWVELAVVSEDGDERCVVEVVRFDGEGFASPSV